MARRARIDEEKENDDSLLSANVLRFVDGEREKREEREGKWHYIIITITIINLN